MSGGSNDPPLAGKRRKKTVAGTWVKNTCSPNRGLRSSPDLDPSDVDLGGTGRDRPLQKIRWGTEAPLSPQYLENVITN